MTTDGIIAILLAVIGFLVISWIGIASMWVREKISDHAQRIDEHDDRIMILEKAAIQEQSDRREMLSILRNMRNAG